MLPDIPTPPPYIAPSHARPPLTFLLPTVTLRCSWTQGSFPPSVIYPTTADAVASPYFLGFTLDVLAVWGLESPSSLAHGGL